MECFGFKILSIIILIIIHLVRIQILMDHIAKYNLFCLALNSTNISKAVSKQEKRYREKEEEKERLGKSERHASMTLLVYVGFGRYLCSK